MINLSFNTPGAEASVVGVVTGKVAVFIEVEFGVAAGIGNAYVLTHFYC
jgi:hypothetical protein